MALVVSIIIPTYNSEHKILTCLNSITTQSFQDFEVIIQDGTSTDDTINLVKKHYKEDNRIKFFAEPDKGVYDAMNKAMQRATGNWIYFLGSDDQLYNENVLREIFQLTEINNYNVIYGNVKIVGNTSWAKNGDVYDGKFDVRKLLKKNICHQGIFYKRQFINSIKGYNTNYKLCADWDYNLRCWAKQEFLYIDKIIAFFYAGGESTKSNVDTLFWNDFLKNILSYFKITIFNPLVNHPEFAQYDKIIELQKKRSYFKNFAIRVKRYIQL